MTVQTSPGATAPLNLSFFNQATGGVLADPSSVTLDITYGTAVGLIADYAGPFPWTGASSPIAGQVYRTGTGLFAFQWQVPPGTAAGVYVANWTCVYGANADVFIGEENIIVTGGGLAISSLGVVSGLPAVPADTGYWTGSIAYTPPAGSTTQYSPVTIPFGSVDSNGIAWILKQVTGWDSPDVQGAGVIPRSGDHGAWASTQYYAARMITLTVLASAASQSLRDTARAVLQQACPVSDLALFTYSEPIPKQAQVRRSGRIAETYPTLADVEFTIGLVAPDPRKYGTQVLTARVNPAPSTGGGFPVPLRVPFSLGPLTPGGQVTLTNTGTFETRPLVTFAGPVTSPALINLTTGQTVSWTGLVVPAGKSLVADFNARQSFVGGAYRPADLASSWWVLPPGQSVIAVAGQNDAGASVSISWSPAWI